jgi:hypothetical protein
MQDESFIEIGQDLGMIIKHPHTIIEKWPMKIKLRPEEAGSKEEFEILLASPHSGAERYVEWKNRL